MDEIDKQRYEELKEQMRLLPIPGINKATKKDKSIELGGLVHRRLDAQVKIQHLLNMDLITKEQYKSIWNMISSPDLENLTVAEELIKEALK